MGFKCGLVGLPNVGKSTIFNALTSQQVAASNYPFCTIDPNIGIVPLKDERLEKIDKIVGSAKVTPTTLEFIDIAGLVEDASKGEGLGNQFLNHIQGVDAIAHVVRCFEDENVAHTSPQLDPVSDAAVVITELILKDLEIIERRLVKLNVAVKSGDPKLKEQQKAFSEIQQRLSQGIPLKKMDLKQNAKELIAELNLLTMKPAIFIANVGEDNYQHNPYAEQLQNFADQQNEPCIMICGKVQEEISQLDAESQREFLEEWGLDELSLDKIVRAGYQVLDLITFFTANKNEAHAWTIPRGTYVHKAAGKIHSDFEKGFIKAEVIKLDDLFKFGSEAKVREHGAIAIHGKDYIVEDGDLILFRFHN
ncbi:MAG: redox-regulated ATPase YchF [bacterium]|nr:MAG: redox-regulated ATPase YchF [bacterium]